MKKILILFFSLMAVTLLAKSVDEPLKIDKETKKRINKTFIKSDLDDMFSGLKYDFTKSTGDKNFDKYLHKSFEEFNWRAANFYYMFNYEEKDVMYKGKEKKLTTPGYKEALELFARSVKDNGNILSAYQGFRILEKYFFYIGKNRMTDKYLDLFTSVLIKNKYCVGYLYAARANTKKYSNNPDYLRAINLLKTAKKECKKEGIHDFYLTGIKHEYIKVKTMYKVELAKNKAKGASIK